MRGTYQGGIKRELIREERAYQWRYFSCSVSFPNPTHNIIKPQINKRYIAYFILLLFLLALCVWFKNPTTHRPRRHNTTANTIFNTIKSEKSTVPQTPRSLKTKDHKELTSRPTPHLTPYLNITSSTVFNTTLNYIPISSAFLLVL